MYPCAAPAGFRPELYEHKGERSMQKLRLFFKKYWITILIYVGLFALYAYLTASGRADPYLFPKVKAIGRAFWKNRSMMLLNMVSSFRLVIPSIVISVAISLMSPF